MYLLELRGCAHSVSKRSDFAGFCICIVRFAEGSKCDAYRVRWFQARQHTRNGRSVLARYSHLAVRDCVILGERGRVLPLPPAECWFSTAHCALCSLVFRSAKKAVPAGLRLPPLSSSRHLRCPPLPGLLRRLPHHAPRSVPSSLTW